MLPIWQVGPLAVPVPGLVVLVGLWLGLTLSERNAPRFGIPGSQLYNLTFVSLIAGVIGARLSYVLQYPAAFMANPLSLISLNPDLLDVWGGAFAAVVVGLVYAQRQRLPLWSVLDALTPLLAVMAVAFGLAHLASGTAFGSPTDLPWGIELWGMRRHPTQIYELLAAGLILLIAWPGKPTLPTRPPGSYFLSFIALSAAARIFLEAFRGDSPLLLGGLRAPQLAAWLILALCLWGLYRSRAARLEEGDLPN